MRSVVYQAIDDPFSKTIACALRIVCHMQAGVRCQQAITGKQKQQHIYVKVAQVCVVRSYHQEYRRSHQNSQLKPVWAGLVLG